MGRRRATDGLPLLTKACSATIVGFMLLLPSLFWFCYCCYCNAVANRFHLGGWHCPSGHLYENSMGSWNTLETTLVVISTYRASLNHGVGSPHHRQEFSDCPEQIAIQPGLKKLQRWSPRDSKKLSDPLLKSPQEVLWELEKNVICSEGSECVKEY